MANLDGTKSGGRTKGVANRLTMEYKEMIEASGPIEFLIQAFTTGIVGAEVLTAKERCDIARDLAKKIVPDLKAIEHKGDGEGGKIIVQMISYKDLQLGSTPAQLES